MVVSRIFMNCIDKFYLPNSLGIFFRIVNSRTRYNEPPAPGCFTIAMPSGAVLSSP